jgi:hypothetical protein
MVKSSGPKGNESRGMRAGWEGGRKEERGRITRGEAEKSRKKNWERRGGRRGEWTEGRRVLTLGAKENDGGVGGGCREARAGKQRTEQE